MNDIDYILKKFGLKLKHFFWDREGLICHTDKGYFVVKKNNTSEQQLLFIYEMKKVLMDKGLLEIDPYEITYQGLPYFEKNTELYTVCSYIEGNFIDFSNQQHTKLAVEKLAYIHKYTRGLPNCEAKLATDIFQKKLIHLRHIKRYIGKKSILSEIDVLFLKNYQYCMDIAHRTILLIDKLDENYQYCLCHNNIKEENIKLWQDDIYYLNFELAYAGYYLWDLSELIRRTMRWHEFSYDHALELINIYTKVHPIDDKNYELLKLMLAFPDKFYRLCMQYYNHKKVMAGTSVMRKFLGSMDVELKQKSLLKMM